jgi:hypothetical protein
MTATPSGRLSTAGKQVLLDGQHLCDARDEVAAEGIALAIDFVGVGIFQIPPEVNKKILEMLR